jgi:mono/diheme cytochrome c family protein
VLLLGAATAAGAQPPALSQDPFAGARVFGAKGCARCHAINGIGGTTGPDLSRMSRPRSFYDLAAALWSHAPRMAERMRELGVSRPQLDARESGDLVAFLFTANYFEPKGNADAGRRLFTAKRCVVCHQVGGTGGVVGPSLDGLKASSTPIALAAAMWNHGPQMAETMRAKGIPRPTFTGAELRDLMAYVGGTAPAIGAEPVYVLPGNADAGRRLFADKRCIACHGVAGQGAKTAPDLAERAAGSLSDFAAAMWNKAPAMTAAMKGAGVAVPALRPSEMADIVGYLIFVRQTAQPGEADRGLAVAKAKGCLGCHAIRGERGKPASDLGEARSADTLGGALSALWNHAFLTDAGGTGARAAWAPMTGEEMAHLVAFLQATRRAR